MDRRLYVCREVSSGLYSEARKSHRLGWKGLAKGPTRPHCTAKLFRKQSRRWRELLASGFVSESFDKEKS